MSVLSLENISKAYTDKSLFENINFTINEDETIALVGLNGTGKSTLLKIIAGEEESPTGKRIHMRNIRIQYLPQTMDYDENSTVLEHIFRVNHPSMDIIKSYEKLIEQLKVDPDNLKLQEKLFEVTEKMDANDLWQIESDAKSILSKLGINDYHVKMKTLSGGQKRRVFLASALIHPSDLLILDEPTNHLDDKMIQYLEEYLKRRKGSTIMVTHDRYFLDRITNRIVELYNGGLYSYIGNYTDFLTQKAEREILMQNLEHKRAQLYKQELAWIRTGARARSTKQKARINRFEDLANQKIDTSKSNVDISVGGRRIGKKVIDIENISKSYGDKVIIKDFSHIVQKDDRIGIIGTNGSGKTTLLNMISGLIKPDKGNVDIGETIKIGYFTQENIDMDTSQRVIDYIKETAEYINTLDGSVITASQMLERFLFKSHMQYSIIQKLSGGERKRLYLLKILMESPNVLLLDEPTNDLDIETLTVLEDYIDEFNGPVISVSHDRYFLDKVASKILVTKEDGSVDEYFGNYTDYYNKYQEQIAIENTEKNEIIEEKSKTTKPKSKALKFSYNEQREYDSIDETISNIESKIENIDKKIELATTDFVLLQELMDEKSKLEEELEQAMDRWVYLSELWEKIQNQKNKK